MEKNLFMELEPAECEVLRNVLNRVLGHDGPDGRPAFLLRPDETIIIEAIRNAVAGR